MTNHPTPYILNRDLFDATRYGLCDAVTGECLTTIIHDGAEPIDTIAAPLFALLHTPQPQPSQRHEPSLFD